MVTGTGIPGAMLARVQQEMYRLGLSEETVQQYPPQELFDVPSLPPRVQDLSREEMLRLYYEFTRYFAHLSARVGMSKASVRGMELRVNKEKLLKRKEMREFGMNRDEAAEHIEAQVEFTVAQVDYANAQSELDYLVGVCEGVAKITRMLEEYVFARGARVDSNNVPPSHAPPTMPVTRRRVPT